MDIVFGIAWHVEIEHVAETGDVEATGRHIRRDHQRNLAILEALKRLEASRLRHVAVKRHSVEIMPLQRGHQRGDVALAVTEDHCVFHIFAVQQRAECLALALWGCPGQMLGNGVGSTCRRCHFDDLRVGDELVAQCLDVVRQGCREEQRLAERRQQADNALHIGNEAHIQHAVGLVDDKDLHICQQDLAALEMVEKAARRGDQYIDSLVQGGVLLGKADTADKKRHRQFVIGAEFLEGVGHLGSQFAGRGQDQ